MFAFICNECGYGMALSSGVPFMCPICNKILCFRRTTHEEYHNCETNDGKIKEVIIKNKECPKCRGRGEIMVRKPFLREIDGSEDIGGTPYPEGCPRCNGRGVIL